MARTQTAANTTPESPPEPDTQAVARPSPVLAWPSEWPVPELPAQDRRRSRGLPMAPVLAGAGNTTALTTTAAYSAGGPVAAAAAGVVIAAGATAAVLRRRASVRRAVATRAGGATAVRGPRSGSGSRSGLGAGSRRGGSASRRSGGGGRSGSRSGALRRSGGALSGGGRGGRRSGAGSGSGRSGSGLFGQGSGRHAGAGHRGVGATMRQQRKADQAAAKAARKAIKRAAKDLAAKSGQQGKGHALRAAAGRAARAAYRAGRPLLTRGARAARTVGRQGRRAAVALWDGVRAGLVGAATALWQGRWRAFMPAVRAMWRRLKNNRDAASATDPGPAVADTVRRPTTPTTSTGGTGMSGGGHHFTAPAMEFANSAANYHPTGMLQVGSDFAGLEEALRLHAEGMKVTVDNADAKFPLHPNIVEIMRQIHALQLKAAELATELSPAFKSLHDVDIARLENPRKGVVGERMWDVSANL